MFTRLVTQYYNLYVRLWFEGSTSLDIFLAVPWCSVSRSFAHFSSFCSLGSFLFLFLFFALHFSSFSLSQHIHYFEITLSFLSFGSVLFPIVFYFLLMPHWDCEPASTMTTNYPSWIMFPIPIHLINHYDSWRGWDFVIHINNIHSIIKSESVHVLINLIFQYCSFTNLINSVSLEVFELDWVAFLYANLILNLMFTLAGHFTFCWSVSTISLLFILGKAPFKCYGVVAQIKYSMLFCYHSYGLGSYACDRYLRCHSINTVV